MPNKNPFFKASQNFLDFPNQHPDLKAGRVLLGVKMINYILCRLHEAVLSDSSGQLSECLYLHTLGYPPFRSRNRIFPAPQKVLSVPSQSMLSEKSPSTEKYIRTYIQHVRAVVVAVVIILGCFCRTFFQFKVTQ